jgi:Flp pilus assembly pilin Flp
MNLIRKLCVQTRKFERGQSMTEYALILGAIAVVCIAAYQLMGSDINAVVGSVNAVL